MSSIRLALVAGVFCLCLAPAVASAEVRLGSAAFNPSPYAEGFGEVRPTTVYNGGVPSGLIRNIAWKRWGGKTAIGTGRNAIYKPVGGYFPMSARIRLKATSLGTCPGEEGQAYRNLLVRIPLWPRGPLGPWQAWNGRSSLCGDGSRSRWRSRGGYCGYTGEFEVPGETKTIMAFRVGCRAARKVAKRSKHEVASSPLAGPRRKCGWRGCRVRMRGFRCRFHRLHPSDYSNSEGEQLSIAFQRVSCKRGRASILWWYGRWW